MKNTSLIRMALGTAVALGASIALAAPARYTIDPDHTYPSFQADHMGGLSNWRGKFNRSSGFILLDRQTAGGTLEVTVDIGSIDFGHDKLNEHAKSGDIFDVASFPTAIYKGTLKDFKDGAPTRVDGILTLKGVSKPLELTINSFLCKSSPISGREVCGADASASFDRDTFGVDYGKAYGFKMETILQIQVEAIRDDEAK
ncbi:polyisoprenoid-binding protein [Steroidobacter denitrificans]|uniref:Polyisoprenoid-binding protein n=1 Tax=Steroidobacter denitrificans TaxID=465721 RepID=A0A127F8Q5_STEDE|nr:YceI family protein [Steroidobacter denitrificans]AMN45919.1 polyisoprenoid-binding protein [Steroidobacter denitrificans]